MLKIGLDNWGHFILNVTMNYKIDIASYFDYLNEHGLDVSDPCKLADMVTSYTLNLPLNKAFQQLNSR